jgi:hypothetical protein
MSDKRSAQRRRCLIGARVILSHQASNISCIVRSLSETGAKIEFEAVQLLPQEFVLQLATGVEYAVNGIAWQRDRQVGVTFCQTSSATDAIAFENNRSFNIAAFSEEISGQAPRREPNVTPSVGKRPAAAAATQSAYPRNDFGVEYRKRMAAQQRKTA